ncbi:hypothetical protein D9758_017241 [Tetrapyrgos nigripes]|uniref:F-box domain-containing protein n=1 Tax=Tetrapyrgos nigripes TaxID=182062 RepID=A0A8H5C5Z5_9AGAR|nr:hypothetical protein D9758_017241 [Tetrapyrgos nigripes]
MNRTLTTSDHFKELVKANEPPLDSEVTAFFASLADVQEKVAKAKSNEDRTSLEQTVVQYKTVLHPMRRLPLDVLGEIFSSVVAQSVEHYETYIYDENYDIPSFATDVNNVQRLPVAWILSWVCVRWRAVCLALPLLWRHVFVSFRQSRMYVCSQATLSYWELLLQRSKAIPLDVVLEQVPYRPSQESDSHPILALLIPTASRWRRLTLATTSGSNQGLLKEIQSSFPSLQFLHIITVQITRPALPTGLMGVSASAIAGKEVRLSGLWDPDILGVPWSEVTSLRLDCICWPLAVLRQADRVKKLTLQSPLFPQLELNRESPITLPSVETLEISGWELDAGLLALLIMPKLHRLIVATIAQLRVSHLVSAFSVHGLPSLRFLDLKLEYISDELCRLLERIPTLEELYLWECRDICDTFLHNFLHDSQPEHGSAPFLPNLTVLEFREVSEHTVFKLELMARVIRYRSGAPQGDDVDATVSAVQGASGMVKLKRGRIEVANFEGGRWKSTWNFLDFP